MDAVNEIRGKWLIILKKFMSDARIKGFEMATNEVGIQVMLSKTEISELIALIELGENG